MKVATKSIQHYPPHLRHVATLPWEIKNSNFLQMWKKTQSNCILITSSFVIHPQVLLFPHTDFIRFNAVQKFWISVEIWQSYRQLQSGNFLRHSVLHLHQTA